MSHLRGQRFSLRLKYQLQHETHIMATGMAIFIMWQAVKQFILPIDVLIVVTRKKPEPLSYYYYLAKHMQMSAVGDSGQGTLLVVPICIKDLVHE